MKRLIFIFLTLLITGVASYAEDTYEVEYILDGRNCQRAASALTVMIMLRVSNMSWSRSNWRKERMKPLSSGLTATYMSLNLGTTM